MTDQQDREKLIALAERCEAATGPDRELDGLIAAAMHIKQLTYQVGQWIKDPEYTASLDAAMTLVPEGWLLQNLSERNASGEWNWRWSAELWNTANDDTRKGHARQAHANPAAPALALCAAALRARATIQERNDDA